MWIETQNGALLDISNYGRIVIDSIDGKKYRVCLITHAYERTTFAKFDTEEEAIEYLKELAKKICYK